MRKMNKRAEITTKEILEIVLTIVAILMLAGLIYLLVSNYFNDKELDQAKASLNFLTAQINNGAKEVVIGNLKGEFRNKLQFDDKLIEIAFSKSQS